MVFAQGFAISAVGDQPSAISLQPTWPTPLLWQARSPTRDTQRTRPKSTTATELSSRLTALLPHVAGSHRFSGVTCLRFVPPEALPMVCHAEAGPRLKKS